jgi:hypothetical protein
MPPAGRDPAGDRHGRRPVQHGGHESKRGTEHHPGPNANGTAVTQAWPEPALDTGADGPRQPPPMRVRPAKVGENSYRSSSRYGR